LHFAHKDDRAEVIVPVEVLEQVLVSSCHLPENLEKELRAIIEDKP
jgi:hypothetical protein